MSQVNINRHDTNGRRHTHVVFHYPNSPGKIEAYQNEVRARHEREQILEQTFVREWNIQPCVTNAAGYNAVNTISEALHFWCENSSTHCPTCNSIISHTLQPNFMTKKISKAKKDCFCKTNRYTVPRFSKIPKPLQNLTKENVTLFSQLS